MVRARRRLKRHGHLDITTRTALDVVFFFLLLFTTVSRLKLGILFFSLFSPHWATRYSVHSIPLHCKRSHLPSWALPATFALPSLR